MKLLNKVRCFRIQITIFVFLLLPLMASAQPTGGGPGGEPPPVPITGIELLLAAGAAYGAKKAYNVYRKGKQ